jgi:hypothetical protein
MFAAYVRKQANALDYMPDSSAQPEGLTVAHIPFVDNNASGVGIDQPVDDANEGGFARS